MFEPLTAVPVVEPFEQQRLELECVVRRRVGDAHQLGKDEKHEEVILLPPGSGNRPSIGGDIELVEQRLQPGEKTFFPSHGVRCLSCDCRRRRRAALAHERRPGF